MGLNIFISGHTSGIGLVTLQKLLNKGANVTGVARRKLDGAMAGLTQIQADLSDKKDVLRVCNSLAHESFDVVILNAGYNTIKPPEAYTPEEIMDICTLNFTAHAALLRACLPGLLNRKGSVIGIGSVSGLEVEKWNNYYGASKAGFHHLLDNMFEQYRRQDLRVTNIIPDIAKTNFYEHQQFEPSAEPDTFITPEAIAEVITGLIFEPPAYVPAQIVMRPQRFALNRKK